MKFDHEVGTYFRDKRNSKILFFVGEASDGEYFQKTNNFNQYLFESLMNPDEPDTRIWHADAIMFLEPISEMEALAWASRGC